MLYLGLLAGATQYGLLIRIAGYPFVGRSCTRRLLFLQFATLLVGLKHRMSDRTSDSPSNDETMLYKNLTPLMLDQRQSPVDDLTCILMNWNFKANVSETLLLLHSVAKQFYHCALASSSLSPVVH